MTDLLDGRFELVERVGAGGMGTVWRAHDRETGRVVAVKLLREHGGAREAARFLREADVLARLSHPGIVAHVAHGATAQGGAYIAMEWVAGKSLSHRLDGAGLTARQAVAVARRVAGALAEVHRLGLIHRDLKPDNLVFTARDEGNVDEVKLIDFGVVRETEELAHLTRTGFMVGTPGYMAPEQARGVRELDARVDVFALGCVLHECLTGTPLFRGDNGLAIQARILLEEPPDVGAICHEAPPPLRALVARMLSKDRDRRPADAAEVGAELAALPELPDGPRRPRRPLRAPQTLELRPPPVRAESVGLAPLPDAPAPDQQLVSVIVASPATSQVAGATTVTPEELDARDDAVRETAARHGAQAALLADGSLVAALTGRGDPAVHARRAAGCARELRDVLRVATMVVVTGTPVAGEDDPIFDRGARSLAAAAAFARMASVPASGILVDTRTASLLGDDLVVSAGKLGHYLR